MNEPKYDGVDRCPNCHLVIDPSVTFPHPSVSTAQVKWRCRFELKTNVILGLSPNWSPEDNAVMLTAIDQACKKMTEELRVTPQSVYNSITRWFDPTNIHQLRAFKFWKENARWPTDFLPVWVNFPTNWPDYLNSLLADHFINQVIANDYVASIP